MSKEWFQENLYYEYVKSRVRYVLQNQWSPSNSERGYIEKCWREGIEPDRLARKFMSKSRDVELLRADGTTVESTLTSEQVENDRPKACDELTHEIDASELVGYKFCPQCGERLSP